MISGLTGTGTEIINLPGPGPGPIISILPGPGPGPGPTIQFYRDDRDDRDDLDDRDDRDDRDQNRYSHIESCIIYYSNLFSNFKHCFIWLRGCLKMKFTMNESKT